jgi:hypothetical protein
VKLRLAGSRGGTVAVVVEARIVNKWLCCYAGNDEASVGNWAGVSVRAMAC